MSIEVTKQKVGAFLKKILWILLLSLVLFSVGYYFYRTYTISEGTRTGILYKISKKGKIFKTYEGLLQLAGVTIMNKESSFEFSVKGDDVYKAMQNLEGKNIRVHYRQLVDAFPWQGDTDYIIYKVEEVK